MRLIAMDYNELERLGKAIAQSGSCGAETDAQGVLVAMDCQAKQVTPLEWSCKYNMIGGKISLAADAMLAEFQLRGGTWDVEERSETRAAATFRIDDREYSNEFTIERAKRNGFTVGRNGKPNHNWESKPENMLWARLISDSMRVIAPAIVAGLYTPGDLDDLPVAEERGKPIDPEVAAEKLQAPVEAKPEPQPEPKPEADGKPEAEPEADSDVDYSICPIGKPGTTKGVAWSELTDAHLAQALKLKDEVLPQPYKDAVKDEMERRQAASEGSDE